jgi:hypothetical protein
VARFAYYDRLSAASKRTYRKSDAIERIELPDIAALRPLAAKIEPALAAADRAGVERACRALVDAVVDQLGAPRVVTRVLERRPSDDWGELHGLYEPDEVTGGAARISVWMRTARKDQVVKFRTFLRTLVTSSATTSTTSISTWPRTFHTQGFYSRESKLVRELLGEEALEPPMNADNPS